ncbi:hypothetical protein [Glycomyces xiaoerkulensis]|uniref:hypothetical protein n=1 Tax=Glycomyces xiaoerkulensis TaxID=2038139 RepID=UPI000C2655D3|nr:hypothetical protein [Glycomyces xiaoerkulensis]
MDTDDDDADGPRPGDFRIGDKGQVLVYDGKNWEPYRRLPDSDPGSVLRMRSPKPGTDGGAAE